MGLNLDLDGISTLMQITQYTAPEKRNCMHDYWCECKFSISSGDWLNYNDQGQLLLSSEVDELRDEFNNLLNGNTHHIKEISFTEPDFDFVLFPIQDVRKNPKVLYCSPGHEFIDISAEWRVHFWNDGLTANILSLALGRNELKQFADYLFKITNSR